MDLIIIGPNEDKNARAIAKSSGGYVFRPKTLQQGLQIMELETVLFGYVQTQEAQGRLVVSCRASTFSWMCIYIYIMTVLLFFYSSHTVA